jgi:hypothetical protein
MVYNQSQKNTFLAWFEHNHYHDEATQEQLTKEISILASKIQNWFRKQISKQTKLESRCLRKGSNPGA